MNIMTKRGSLDNIVTFEHICDTTADMASIDKAYVTLGSTCIVLQGGDGGMEVYIANSNEEWIPLIMGGSNSGGSTTIINGASFHVCTSNEISFDGTPKISNPEENVIYLVPTPINTSDDSGSGEVVV